MRTKAAEFQQLKTHYEIMANIGKFFGDRKLLSYAPARYYDLGKGTTPQERIYVKTECKCGSIDEVPWSALKNGHQQRCAKCATEKRNQEYRKRQREKAKRTRPKPRRSSGGYIYRDPTRRHQGRSTGVVDPEDRPRWGNRRKIVKEEGAD